MLARGLIGLAALGMLALADSGPAAAETRTLTFKNLHTKETLTATYMRNGRYDPGGLRQINHILRDWRRDEATEIDPHLIDILWEVRRATGSQAPVHVVSAYRSPVTNAALRSRSSGVAENSLHTRGRALDFNLPDVPLSRLREVALKFQAGGVGFYPGSSFIHIDTGNVRSWPRLSRQQLANLFPDGRTLHLPADGKPLPGFEQARADAARGTLSRVRAGSTGTSGGGLLAALFGGGRGGGETATRGAGQQPADPSTLVRSPATTAGAASPPAEPAQAPVPAAPQEEARTQVAALTAPPPMPRPRFEEPASASLMTAETPELLRPTVMAGLTTAALPRERPALSAREAPQSTLSSGALEALMALAPPPRLDAELPFAETFGAPGESRPTGPRLLAIDLEAATLRPAAAAQSSLHGPALARLSHPQPQAVSEISALYEAMPEARFIARTEQTAPNRFASATEEDPAAAGEELPAFAQAAMGLLARLFR